MDRRKARLQAAEVARGEIAANPVYLDTETTGMGPSDEVVEVCVLNADGSVIIDTLVRPKGRLSAEAVRIHGITPGMLADAPAWPEVWPKLGPVLSRRRVLVYNAEFDLRLMKQSHRMHGLEWMLDRRGLGCIMDLYAAYYGQWDSRRGSYRWQRLKAAARQCGIELPNTHRARDDALLARAVLHHMAGSAVDRAAGA